MGTRVDGSTIRLTGTVGDMATWYPDEEPGITSDDVNSALAQVGRTKDVTITLNSGGGIASEGAAIHAVLSAHKGRKTIIVQGVAASAASVIAMAGDDIFMSPGAVMMIHDPSGLTMGTAADHETQLRSLNTIATAMAGIYAARTGQTIEAVRADMRAELWMDPAEAVRRGYATGIVTSASASTVPAAATTFDYTLYRHAPAYLMALAMPKGWHQPTAPYRPSAPHMATLVQVGARPTTDRDRSAALRAAFQPGATATAERRAATAAMATTDAMAASMQRIAAGSVRPAATSTVGRQATPAAVNSGDAMLENMKRIFGQSARPAR